MEAEIQMNKADAFGCFIPAAGCFMLLAESKDYANDAHRIEGNP